MFRESVEDSTKRVLVFLVAGVARSPVDVVVDGLVVPTVQVCDVADGRIVFLHFFVKTVKKVISPKSVQATKFLTVDCQKVNQGMYVSNFKPCKCDGDRKAFGHTCSKL